MSVAAPVAGEVGQERHGRETAGFFQKELMGPAIGQAFRKLDPRELARNPVMLVVEISSVLTTVDAIRYLVSGSLGLFSFTGQISIWLWLTVLFSTFAEAMAEGRGAAHAETLRRTRTETSAKKETPAGVEEVSAATLVKGDVVVVEAGDIVPGDGEVIEGVAAVDESAITGESAPVIRESGGDRSAVTGGTRVISDRVRVQITAGRGESFLDRMISLIENARRQKTPNEIALAILIAALTLIFLVVVITLAPITVFSKAIVSVTILIALLVCLVPTTIGGLLSAIGISGMNRLFEANVLALSGRAVEAAGDVNVILLDKTGTLTLGNRHATAVIAAAGVTELELAEAARLSSLADETPEGRSIVAFAEEHYGRGGTGTLADGAPAGSGGAAGASLAGMEFVPFTAQTRMSGVDVDGREIRKGAVDSVAAWAGTSVPVGTAEAVDRISREGGTPLLVAEGVAGTRRLLGVIQLKDVVKTGIRDRLEELHKAGIKTVMITGDNPVTAAAIAGEVGVQDFLAEATPERKMEYIQEMHAEGYMVGMVGDGTNDAPALAHADLAVAMNSGTMAAREAGNMVDLDSSPTKLIDIVQVGKQILITRGALTTFSVANDVAKYFAIIPAMFVVAFPGLEALNVMRLHSPASAILSAVIFNAVIIPLLIPLALKGVRYKATSAAQILRKNLLWYGLGGIVAPFVGIKLIDMFITLVHIVPTLPKGY
ncbi:MAG: potassium-transporting ATPase subunit KdpB [Acidimicrobiales bacterium]